MNGGRLFAVQTVRTRKKRISVLWRKLCRDYARNIGQCAMIVLMCALGTFIFSGIDGTARLMDTSLDAYYDRTALADLWLSGSSFSHGDIMNVRKLDSVADVQPRTTAEFHARGLGKDRVLVTHAVDGDFRVSAPVVKEGAVMNPDDIRGCMLDKVFARENGLKTGDTVTLDIYGQKIEFTVRALIASPEHVYISRSINSDPLHYGFIYVSHKALQYLPVNEIAVRLKPGVDAKEIETLLDDMFPSAIVFGREMYQSPKAADNNTEIYRNMLKIFPIFYNVAVIIFIASTVARLIGSQRIEIGTMYGLGLSTERIALHYIIYTGVPALLGALLGTVIGNMTIPDIMWSIHDHNSSYPDKIYPAISAGAWIVTGLMVAVNVAICCFALRNISREAKASLLRPQTAVKGNHVMLEKWRWLWERISWNGKIVVRNLTRRRLRTAVTLIGVFFCNTLLVGSSGLTESVDYFVGRYFYKTVRYDLEVGVSGGKTLEYYRNRLDAEAVDGTMIKQVTACSDTDKHFATMYVLADDQTTRYLGENTEYLPMPDHGVIMSRKTAEILGLKKGSDVSFWLPGDTKELKLQVAELADNDLMVGVFIGRRQWETFRRGAFIPDKLQIRQPSASALQYLRESDEVESINDPDSECRETIAFLENLRAVFLLLRISALGFGLVACYSMGVINFIERKREYAVQRVLGCRWGILIRQILAENGLIAILGVLLSVYPGILLLRLSLKFAENEGMVFRPYVSWQTAAVASVLSLLFSLLIALAIAAKLRRLDPVEDLKSVD